MKRILDLRKSTTGMRREVGGKNKSKTFVFAKMSIILKSASHLTSVLYVSAPFFDMSIPGFYSEKWQNNQYTHMSNSLSVEIITQTIINPCHPFQNNLRLSKFTWFISTLIYWAPTVYQHIRHWQKSLSSMGSHSRLIKLIRAINNSFWYSEKILKIKFIWKKN